MAGRQKNTNREAAPRQEAQLNIRRRHMLKYEDPTKLNRAIRSYFKDCDERNAPYTMAGLALWLGFASRASVADYCGRSDELGALMNSAKLRIEQQRSEQLITAEGAAPVGKMFDLKCNFGWQEPPQKQEINNPDGNMGQKVVAVLPDGPKSLDEFQDWYSQMMSQRQAQRAELEAEQAEDAEYTEPDAESEGDSVT